MRIREGNHRTAAWRRPALWLLLALPSVSAPLPPPRELPVRKLDELIAAPGFWDTTPDAFPAQGLTNGFEWTSGARESARSAYPRLTYLGMPVAEAVFWFDTNKLREAAFSLYNRGDQGPTNEAALNAMVATAVRNVSRLTGAKPSSSDIRGAGRLPKHVTAWATPTLSYRLEWAATVSPETRAFRAEYVRLLIRPPQKQATLVGVSQGVSTISAGKRAIEKTPEGDVYLKDVPMVDQGPKGYCAVAATERVLRYFGTSVDQHQIAQLANTQQGTDPESLKVALQRISRSLQIKLTEQQEFNVKTFLKMVDDYNAMARRKGAVDIKLPVSGTINVADVFAEMDPKVLAAARVRNPAAVGRFHDKAVQYVNKKIPLLWSVMLGIVPEKEVLQAGGGHLRLIIGYNDKTREILYTDTWGAGHELKRMSVDDAYTITTALFTIEPR